MTPDNITFIGCEGITMIMQPNNYPKSPEVYVAHAHYAGKRIESDPCASQAHAVASLREKLADAIKASKH